jgi:serine/threonine protein phosphatase PrpC
LLPGASDAAWLVSAYDDRLRANAHRTECELQHFFADLITDVGADFEARKLLAPASRFELPSAGIAFVRLRAANLEYARLGDCRAIFTLPKTAHVLSTDSSPLQYLDAAVLEKMGALRRNNISVSHEQVHRMVQNDLRANRSLLNTEGGYWVLSNDPTAARHMEIGTLPLNRTDTFRGLLVSDGFYRLVDTFRVYPDDAALFRAALNRGLVAMLTELRTLENMDPECAAHPRFKPKDDASAVLFEIIEAP